MRGHVSTTDESGLRENTRVSRSSNNHQKMEDTQSFVGGIKRQKHTLEGQLGTKRDFTLKNPSKERKKFEWGILAESRPMLNSTRPDGDSDQPHPSYRGGKIKGVSERVSVVGDSLSWSYRKTKEEKKRGKGKY